MRFEPSLSESRHSTKLFDDNAKTVQDLLNEFTSYATKHRKWFIGATAYPRLIRSFKFLQRLVDDTSVHLYDGQILSTSHSINIAIATMTSDVTMKARANGMPFSIRVTKVSAANSSIAPCAKLKTPDAL